MATCLLRFQLSAFKFYLQKHKTLLGAALAIPVHKNTQNILHSESGTAPKMKSCKHTSKCRHQYFRHIGYRTFCKNLFVFI